MFSGYPLLSSVSIFQNYKLHVLGALWLLFRDWNSSNYTGMMAKYEEKDAENGSVVFHDGNGDGGDGNEKAGMVKDLGRYVL